MAAADERIYLEEIAPPYLKYTYFKYAYEEPFAFQPKNTGKFDLKNAWWLCETSILAYSNEEFVRQKFASIGLSEVRFFSGESTQCYVANNDTFLILVFRGTEIKLRPNETNPIKGLLAILADVLTDFNAEPVPWKGSADNGKVHKGFKKALDEVWSNGLYDYLKNKERDGLSFWFTGHSLGAALATLAWKRYCLGGNVPGLYTFGSPRVGDTVFGNGFEGKTYRFVNNEDIVTHVPLAGPYHHVGCLKYINAAGVIAEASKSAGPKDSEVKKKIQSLLAFYKGSHILIKKISSLFHLRQVNLADINILFPGALLDHVPTLYSKFIAQNIKKLKS
jgi:triacylglycerol lipase